MNGHDVSERIGAVRRRMAALRQQGAVPPSHSHVLLERALDELDASLNELLAGSRGPGVGGRETQDETPAPESRPPTLGPQRVERTPVEAALQERASVADAVFDAIITIGEDGLIRTFNRGATLIFGYTPKEAIGQPFERLLPEALRTAQIARLRQHIARGGTHALGRLLELVGRRKDGSEFPLELTVAAVRSTAGTYVTVIGRDITERKEAEEALRQAKEELELRVQERTRELSLTNEQLRRELAERERAEESLRQAKEEAERANRAKSEFLSRMSHELRTPLNAIIGFSQVLQMEELPPDQRESVEHIYRAGRHLLDLINEVLDIARIETGRLALSIEPVSMSEVLQESLNLITPVADARRVRVAADRPAVCDRWVLADRQRLKQALLNLLSNAVKYNREGGSVTLTCEITPEGDLRVAVRDTGPGIHPEDLTRLFIPFERLGAEHSQVEGTGIGLALSKGLVEAMSGTIGVESIVGRGSTFWIVLPLATDTMDDLERLGQDLAAASQDDRPPRTILYIEDNLSNLRLVEHILRHRPEIKLLVAMQGGLGLELAREHKPDLILLDLHLPDMNGDKVLQQLQHDSETPDIPVVIISADATRGQKERLLAAGARHYLAKPLDVPQFLAIIDEALHDT